MTETSTQSFAKSQALFERASKTVPMATQTFSKSALSFPMGAAPLFVERGDGAQVWDVDGNQYVDFVLGLLPVVLGYRDPEVDNAIRTQLDKGITLSLATELEAELAERLVRLIPCAELSRRHTLFRSSRSRPTTSDTPICGLTLAASSAHIGGHEE